MGKTAAYENPYEHQCPIIYAMELIGSKWKLPILWNLFHYQEMRYNELKRHVPGITNTVLTRCLRELEADKIIFRYSEGTVPPAVSYQLAPAGQELIPALDGLYHWGEIQQDKFININKN